MDMLPSFKLEGPCEFFASLWRAVPRNIKIVFFWTLAFGFVTHLFMFMNKLPNHDDMYEFSLVVNHNLSLGRWFRNVIWQLGGEWSTPFVRGTLALLFLSAGSCCVIAALEFRTLFFSLIAASLLAASPVLSSMFAFMFMADAFQFAMLCASAAALLSSRSSRGLIVGIPLLVLSLGTYQAYFFFAASLLLILIIRRAASGAKWTEVGALAVRSAQLLAGALGVYIVVTKLVTAVTGVSLSHYQGVNSLSGGSLASSLLRDLPHIVLYIYQSFLLDMFTAPLDGAGTAVTAARCVLTALVPVMLCFAARRACGRGWAARFAFCAACSAVLPLSLCGLYLIGALNQSGMGVYMHVVMTYAGILLWVFAANAADLCASVPVKDGAKEPGLRTNVRAISLWGAAVCCAVLVWNGYVFCNETYFKMYMGYEKAYAFSVQLVQRIGELKPDGPKALAFVGNPRNLVDNRRIPSGRYRMMTAAFDGPELIGCNQYHIFLRDYLGCKYVSSLSGSYVCGVLSKMPEVEAMPMFPAAGSVKIVKNRIVVKLYDSQDNDKEKE